MIFNVTGGGGTSLNFKVVASPTEPSNPKENTIWVKTNIPSTWASINSVVKPGWTASEGYISIYYNSYGSSPGNADSTLNFVKKHGITQELLGKLHACYQYQSGAWKSVYAYIYKSGNWVQFSSEFAATIKVTYPAGANIICVDRMEYTSPDATILNGDKSGSYSFTVPFAGTWYVLAYTDDQQDYDYKSVEITASGQSVSVTLTFFDGYLFNYGSKNENVTGGWETNNVPHASGYAGYPTAASQSDGSMLLTMGNTSKSGMYVTKKKVDLSKYSTITFVGYTYDYNGYGRCALQVMSDIGSLSTDNIVASFYQNSRTVGTYTIDVSSLTGSYYIGFKIIFDAEVKMCSLKLS